jgi:hypothetical protein
MEPVAALILQRRRCFVVLEEETTPRDVKGGGDGAVIVAGVEFLAAHLHVDAVGMIR